LGRCSCATWTTHWCDRITIRQFHDSILMGGPMPIEMVRARLKGEKISRDFKPQWRFADDEAAAVTR
jgi:hypothetical protein